MLHCRLPGDYTTVLPFACKADEVFDLEALLQPQVEVAGVALSVRESFFAVDPRVPESVRQSTAIVAPHAPLQCSMQQLEAAAVAVAVGSSSGAVVPCLEVVSGPVDSRTVAPNPPATHLIGAALSGEALRALAPHLSHLRWLHVQRPEQVFAGWTQPANDAAFQSLMQSLTAEWCCTRKVRTVAEGAPPGHVYQLRPWGSPQVLCARQVEPGQYRSYWC